MKVTYAPEDGEARSWKYEPKRVRQSEAEMMEKRAGMSWDELNKALMSGSARARRVLLWHCMRKDHAVLRWEDVPDFGMAEVQVELDANELADVRTAVMAMPDEDESKAAVLAVIEAQIAEAGEPDPKAAS